jgi:hypothetical protein
MLSSRTCRPVGAGPHQRQLLVLNPLGIAFTLACMTAGSMGASSQSDLDVLIKRTE